MTHADPEIDAQWDRAARELERRLRPYMQDLLRWDFCRTFIRDLASEGFRPPLRLPPPAPAKPAAGPSLEYLAAKAELAGADHVMPEESR